MDLVRAQQHALTVPADQLPQLPAGQTGRMQRAALPEGVSTEDAELAERMALAADPNCTFYGLFAVCGEIRNKYNAMGGPSSFLGFPKSPEYMNPGGTGYRSEFLHGSIYWSAATGAHPITPLFMTKWSQHGWEAGWMGYPTSDEIPNGDSIGSRQHFETANAAIYWNSAITAPGLAVIGGAIRDKWGTVGWETPGSLLGYPVSDEIALPDGAGRMNRFERGTIYWHPQLNAHIVNGGILDQWAVQGYETGPAGYPIEDPRQISPAGVTPVGFEQQFQNQMHAFPRRISDTYCGSICTDEVFEAFPQLYALIDLIPQPGAPSCDALPAPIGDEETFYECFDPAPGPLGRQQDGPTAKAAQPSGSILRSNCYSENDGVWMTTRHYACVHVSDLDSHRIKSDRDGASGGNLNYRDVEIAVNREDDHGRKIRVDFRAVPDLSGLGATSILEIYPKCTSLAPCNFSPSKGYQNVYNGEPVHFTFTTTMDSPSSEGTVTAPQVYFEMQHVSTGSGPGRYKTAAFPYGMGYAPVIRCDRPTSDDEDLAGTSDCIFPEAMPAIDYGPEANVPEVSWHINQAQQSGLPGTSKYFPLHRATSAESALTRKIACKRDNSYPVRLNNQQCDEYPFAAAREGAQLGGLGTERTFEPDCGMVRNGNPLFPAGSGPDGFSVCMVNGQQNNSAGQAIRKLHQRSRVLPGDAYVVLTYPGSPPTPGGP